MTSLEIVRRIREILNSTTEEPAEAMIREGQALMDIGKTLKGKSVAEARAIMRAVSELEEVH